MYKDDFYNFLFDLWFVKHTPNKKWAASAEASFKNGAYFRVDLNDKLSILSINSLLVSAAMDVPTKIGNEINDQWNWLEKNL